MKIIPQLLIAATFASLSAGCMKDKQAEAANQTAAAGSKSATTADSPIDSAESAAPAAISKAAAIMSADSSGKMTSMRAGTNGWTCMPDSPATPGPDPMCFDGNAGNWIKAWVGHKAPPSNNVGLIYMLEGGTDASNVDPYATKPSAGNDWVKTGPHLMVVGSTEILAGHPSGAKPETSAPYVMWAGTPYAHLMVPVGVAQ